MRIPASRLIIVRLLAPLVSPARRDLQVLLETMACRDTMVDRVITARLVNRVTSAMRVCLGHRVTLAHLDTTDNLVIWGRLDSMRSLAKVDRVSPAGVVNLASRDIPVHRANLAIEVKLVK